MPKQYAVFAAGEFRVLIPNPDNSRLQRATDDLEAAIIAAVLSQSRLNVPCVVREV
jgi:hypothetical protein